MMQMKDKVHHQEKQIYYAGLKYIFIYYRLPVGRVEDRGEFA